MDVETADDDFVVIVVGDEEDEFKTENTGSSIGSSEVTIKEEYLDEELQDFNEDVYDYSVESIETKQEYEYTAAPAASDSEGAMELEFSESDYDEYDELYDSSHSSLENETVSQKKTKSRFNIDVAEEKHRYRMLEPSQRKSIVEELCEKNPALRTDKEGLIHVLYNLMKQTKPPPPPKDYYFVNNVMFECVRCNALTDSERAAARHWQEKHGERYLVCYACGVDFRSTTNLYKHEKRCGAPDALVVLKARALCVGRKGRGRPYMPLKPVETVKKPDKSVFVCSRCPAMFRSSTALQSHENAHAGNRPFRCEHCPAAYTSKSGLTKHGTKHFGRKFICDHCGRAFSAKSPLIAHLSTHLTVRPYVCEICGRSFAVKFGLQYHIERAHNQAPPPVQCTICDKRYTRITSLKKHMQRAHGMKLVTKKMFYQLLPLLSETQVKQALIMYKSDIYGIKGESTNEIIKPEVETQEIANDKSLKEETSVGNAVEGDEMQYVEGVEYAANDVHYELDLSAVQDDAVDNKEYGHDQAKNYNVIDENVKNIENSKMQSNKKHILEINITPNNKVTLSNLEY